MIGAGIMNDDYVIVRRRYADDGDIVVALLGDEATVNAFLREQKRPPAARGACVEPIITRDVDTAVMTSLEGFGDYETKTAEDSPRCFAICH